jgi:hypothetical protein
MKLVMNIKFDPIETESSDSSLEDDDDMLDTFKNSIEEMQPIIDGIGKKIEGLQKKLDGYEDDLLNKMVSPKTDAFKDFWEHHAFPPTVPFKTVFLTILAMAESLDMPTRSIRFNKSDADRFAKGIRGHTIFTLIPIIIDGVTLL